MEAFVAASEQPKSPGHPFYAALNRLLAENGFDALVEKLRAPYQWLGHRRGRLQLERWILVSDSGPCIQIGMQERASAQVRRNHVVD